MELRQLRYFVAVADTQSISAAARKLHVVQSAISHQIANLESELGAELFTRGKAGVTLTSAGQFLYRNAVTILKHVETASQEVKRVDKEIRGSVAVGIPNSTAAVLALHLLTAVRQELPHVQLTIVEGLSGLLAEQLASGRLDFSILFDTEPMRGFVQKPLLAEKLHFVSADPEMIRTHGGKIGISLREVLRRPLILPPQPNGIRVLLEREASRVGLQPNVVAGVTGVQTMRAAVHAGVADSVMMAANAIREHGTGELLVQPIRAPVIERIAALCEPAQFALPAAASCVRDIMLRLVNELVSRDQWPGARLLECS
ncbi:MAG: LysR family transcriptional regulator [Ramlibacter sp.]|nr:LysR family transcriptional regulator [Ramlibacter sp.]